MLRSTHIAGVLPPEARAATIIIKIEQLFWQLVLAVFELSFSML
jgi:hypothetical protein